PLPAIFCFQTSKGCRALRRLTLPSGENSGIVPSSSIPSRARAYMASIAREHRSFPRLHGAHEKGGLSICEECVRLHPVLPDEVPLDGCSAPVPQEAQRKALPVTPTAREPRLSGFA